MSEKHLNYDYFTDDENLHIDFLSAPRERHMHSNEFWEITYVYEGYGSIHTKENSEIVKAGGIVLIKPNTEYAIASPPDKADIPARLCRIIFTQNYFEKLKSEYGDIFKFQDYKLYNMIINTDCAIVRLSDDDAQNIYKIMWLAAHEYNHYKTGSEKIINNSMLNLLICATRLYEYQINDIPPTISTNKSLEELKKYIRANFAYNLTLDFLASQVHLSREHLSRSFKQYTGQTISEYLLDVRMTRAKQMLRNPKNAITDIGAYCGYNTIGNFQRAFKKYTGMSPSEYRKQCKDTN